MNRAVGVASTALALCLGAAGCGGAPACVPGTQVACACAGGLTGTQLCGGGGVFGPCACRPPVAPASTSAATPPPAPAPAASPPPTPRGPARARSVPAASQALDLALRFDPACAPVIGQSFRVDAPGDPADGTSFVPLVCRGTIRVLQVRGSTVLHTFEDHEVNTWEADAVDAVAFRDLNSDGMIDLMVVASGAAASAYVTTGDFWIQTASGWRADLVARRATITEENRGSVPRLSAAVERYYQTR